jgi:acyl-CoA dehydrogenase
MNAEAAPLRPDAADEVSAAVDVARRFAASVDEENRFPAEALEALRSAGLLGFLVPARHGGRNGDFSQACRIAARLGSACLSTALIWAMHNQQVMIIADHAPDSWADVLSDVAESGALIASATSEPGKSGILLRAHAPLESGSGVTSIDREAPVVSYGNEADWFLVTMRAHAQAPDTDVRYVLLRREEGEVAGDWRAMGMRGTRSVPMRFRATIPSSRVLDADFRTVALATAVPTAHLGWCSAWHGAAQGAFDRFVALLRNGGASERKRLGSDLFLTRLGEARLALDLTGAMLRETLDRYEQMRDSPASTAGDDPQWSIALNGLKVAVSRHSHAVVDLLVTMAGLARGYLQEADLALERTLRDLRSAALMVGNDQLLQLNAHQLLLNPLGPMEESHATPV